MAHKVFYTESMETEPAFLFTGTQDECFMFVIKELQGRVKMDNGLPDSQLMILTRSGDEFEDWLIVLPQMQDTLDGAMYAVSEHDAIDRWSPESAQPRL